MSLRDEIKPLTGNRRKFFLLRMSDMETRAALHLTGVAHGTYNSWLQDQEFVSLYRRLGELASEYKHEAIQMLRRDNQLEAVLLEGKIIRRMKEELESGANGDSAILRSNLAKEVYSKLISDLDAQPQVQAISWEQRLQQIFTHPPEQITEGEVIDAQSEADSESESQPAESQSLPQGEQAHAETEEKTQEE